LLEIRHAIPKACLLISPLLITSPHHATLLSATTTLVITLVFIRSNRSEEGEEEVM